MEPDQIEIILNWIDEYENQTKSTQTEKCLPLIWMMFGLRVICAQFEPSLLF